MAARRVIEPVSVPSTASIIADRIRAAIHSGHFAAGQQLHEVELAREFGISRGPLREGMQRLTQEGLLISIKNRGLFVVELTEDDVRDVYLARESIERTAARQIFLTGNPERAGERLLRIWRDMERAARRNDVAAIGHWDVRFHECLVAQAKSPRLSRIHRTLMTETKLCINALGGSYPPPDERVPEHLELAEAMRAGDPDLFDRLLTEHMADAVRRLAKVLPPAARKD
ncbi:MAG TPA: GntR family transcriptional regulator [Microlunatus sp.]|nr:GntR family transcriptional regulator [Microlunatus sp.]